MTTAKQMALEALKFAYNDCESDYVRDQKIDPAIAALEAEIARVVEPVAETIKFSDRSTASAVEKTRRYLTKMADKRQGNSYFFDDGYPREVIADDAAAALAVFEHLAAPPEPVNAELLDACKSAFAVVELLKKTEQFKATPKPPQGEVK